MIARAIRFLATAGILATLASCGLTEGNPAPGGYYSDRDDQTVLAWGDPMFACERFACSEITDCEAYDEGIVCACVYDDGLARSCELTDPE